MATQRKYDRGAEDVGNILALEHVNVTVPDQGLATLFYVNGLGLTRDPYIDFGPANVWINVGSQQFHLPTAEPQVLRGHVGVVVPDLHELGKRLQRLEKRLVETRFSFRHRGDHIEITCPWGNQIRCFGPDTFDSMSLGIPYVQFDVPPGTTNGIRRFYEEVFDAPASTNRKTCTISIGKNQTLRFRENRKTPAPYDGHHIAVYLTNFSKPYAFLKKHRLVTEESDQHQYRFQSIVDPKSGEALFEIEHEVRSLHHPMYERYLVNRNPAQSFFDYHPGRDAFVP
jgi:hypothetical protein